MKKLKINSDFYVKVIKPRAKNDSNYNTSLQIFNLNNELIAGTVIKDGITNKEIKEICTRIIKK